MQLSSNQLIHATVDNGVIHMNVELAVATGMGTQRPVLLQKLLSVTGKMIVPDDLMEEIACDAGSASKESDYDNEVFDSDSDDSANESGADEGNPMVVEAQPAVDVHLESRIRLMICNV